MSKFASPPSHVASTESVTMPDTFDDASTTIDEPGLLGYFIESLIAKAAKQFGIELPVTRYPIGRSFGYPDLSGLKERDLDDDYIELDDDLCRELTECADADPASVKKLLEKHSMKNKFTPDPKFAASPIFLEDADFDFSVDLSLISTVEVDPFYGREDDDAVAHLTKLTELGGLFTTEDKKRNYYVTNLLHFSLKEDAKAWYDALPCGSIKSPQDLAQSFVAKYFLAHKQHAALQTIYNFKQLHDEHLPKAWGRYCTLLKARPVHGIPKNELLDIFYAGLTDESRTYLDSCAGCVFKERTPDDAEELMGKIAKNHDDWFVPETPPSPKKRGMLFLIPEVMQEAKKSMKERGIKTEDVKNLPPIEELCEPTTHPPMVEVHSLLEFNASDVPHGKPPDQCLDELDNFIVKQNHFNEQIQNQLHNNCLVIKSLLDVLSRSVNDVKGLVKHFHMVQIQLEQISNVQKYLLDNNAKQVDTKAYGIKTRGGTHTHDPLYPEGHPKRIEQDYQLQEEDIVSSPKKKNKHKEADNSNGPIIDEEPIVDPNTISISDAETEDDAEPDKDNEKIDRPEIREEEAPDKRKRYMKDIVTQKRKVPNEAISTMLANYSFNGNISKKLGDPDISLQMADKSTTVPVGICEDVPVEVANFLILTDFVVLDMPEDGSMSIILGRPFLNTTAAIIDCNIAKVTFNVNEKEHDDPQV
ncbi:hypothetical protein ZWY2020_039026 [Hordeum vulgare]|nr:hypothetical protein ZWY2020_039026 [Hordeum vulgare]